MSVDSLVPGFVGQRKNARESHVLPQYILINKKWKLIVPYDVTGAFPASPESEARLKIYLYVLTFFPRQIASRTLSASTYLLQSSGLPRNCRWWPQGSSLSSRPLLPTVQRGCVLSIGLLGGAVFCFPGFAQPRLPSLPSLLVVPLLCLGSFQCHSCWCACPSTKGLSS